MTRLRRPIRLRHAVRAAAAVALVGALAACGNNLAGNAIAVGSTTVSDSHLASLVDEVRAEVKEGSPQTVFDEGQATAANVQRLVNSALLDVAAAREGIVVTQGDVDTLIAQTAAGQFGGDTKALDLALATQQNIPASQVQDFARDYLTQAKLGQKLAPGGTTDQVNKALGDYLSALAVELDAQVAPRFGTWDPKTVSLSPVPNDLSTLAGTAAQ